MSVPVIEDLLPLPFGIVLAFFPASDPQGANVAIERAPDSGGAPDTGNAAVIAVVDSGSRILYDFVGGAGPYWYRANHTRYNATDGPYTSWVSARPTVIPETLPTVRDPVAALMGSDLGTTSHTGNTTETTLKTITVPGGKLGATGICEVDFVARKSFTNGTATLRVKFNGDTILAFTTAAAADVGDIKGHLLIRANGPTGNTYGVSWLVSEAGSAYAAAYDTLTTDLTVDRDITITGQLANASDEIAVDFTLTRFSGDED